MALDIDGVFLDTNVFEGAKFDINKRNFKNLIEICQKNDLTIFIDEVVKNEVFKRVEKVVDESTKKLSKQDLEYIRRISEIPDKPNDLKEKMIETLKQDMNHFIEERVEIIPCDYVPNELLTLYFEREYPFEDRKKEEFPDAIMLLSLKNYCEQNDQNIMLISNDYGVREFCGENELKSVKFIGGALDYINEKLMLNEFYKNSIEEIKNEISKYITDDNLEFLFYGYTYEDSISAETYTITQLNIEKIYLVNEDDENAILSLTCEIKIDFEVTTEPYPDYETAYYDKEDGIWFTFSTLQTTFTTSKKMNLDFEIQVIDYDSKDLYVMSTSDTGEFIFDVYCFDCEHGGDCIINQEYFDGNDS